MICPLIKKEKKDPAITFRSLIIKIKVNPGHVTLIMLQHMNREPQ